MTDTYTKIVLTIIALALVAIVATQVAPKATAAFSGCAGDRSDPCYMMIVQPHRPGVQN
jgi:hypothetical protein